MEREGLERGHDAMNHSRVGGSLNNISHTHTHTNTSTNMCTLTVSLAQVEISHFQPLWVNYELLTSQDQGQQEFLS